MKPKVLKFGGVGLQDPAAMRLAAKIILDEPKPKVVVASAMKGVTDAIESALPKVTKDEAQVHLLVSDLKKLHHACAEGIQNKDVRENAVYLVDKALDHLERLLFGVTFTEELTPKNHDLALSFGERLSVRILAGYVQDAGGPSEPFDADKVGVVTGGRFGWASPDIEATRKNLAERLVPKLPDMVPVLTGFFGANAEGHTMLFGRGGSDFSAAIVARAMDAEVLEIWKETNGFMTADPRVVPAARGIEVMSYEEAAELANFGAKILHPRTVEPLQPAGIPIRIRELKNPKSMGTLITRMDKTTDVFIRSVALRKDLAILKLMGPGMGYTPGVAAEVFKVMKDNTVNVINMAASEATFALLMDAKDGPRAHEAVQAVVGGGVIQKATLEKAKALVAVVGKGLGLRVGSAYQILKSVSDARVNIHMISLGASDIAIDFVIDQADAEKALRAVHSAFLEGSVQPSHARSEATVA